MTIGSNEVYPLDSVLIVVGPKPRRELLGTEVCCTLSNESREEDYNLPCLYLMSMSMPNDMPESSVQDFGRRRVKRQQHGIKALRERGLHYPQESRWRIAEYQSSNDGEHIAAAIIQGIAVAVSDGSFKEYSSYRVR